MIPPLPFGDKFIENLIVLLIKKLPRREEEGVRGVSEAENLGSP